MICNLDPVKCTLFPFFREIQCAPDIWSLYEWSNWITPAHSLHRYNTMFYFIFLDNMPEISHDQKEITNSLVSEKTQEGMLMMACCLITKVFSPQAMF